MVIKVTTTPTYSAYFVPCRMSLKTSALADLKNGQVDMLDLNYSMQTDIPSISPSWGKVLILKGFGRQEFGYNMQNPIFGTGVDTPLGQSNPSQAAQAAADIRIAFDYAIPRQLIINNLLAGYGQPGATPMLPSQPYYNSSVTARPYDLNEARHYLQLAGYSPPAITGVGVVNLQGVFNGTSGEPVANETIYLTETTDNSTFPTSLVSVAHTTTDLNGYYTITVTPAAGTYYYYLMDNSTGTPQYTYLQSYTAAAASSFNIMLVLAVGIVAVAIIIVGAVIIVRRRKPKK
jgi:ABC-type transport system substrate-binding protein